MAGSCSVMGPVAGVSPCTGCPILPDVRAPVPDRVRSLLRLAGAIGSAGPPHIDSRPPRLADAALMLAASGRSKKPVHAQFPALSAACLHAPDGDAPTPDVVRVAANR